MFRNDKLKASDFDDRGSANNFADIAVTQTNLARCVRDTRFKDAVDVARTLMPDEPVFCFSPKALHQTAQAFKSGFPGQVTYAVKANPTPQVIETLHSAGIAAFDVASPSEMELVRSVAPEATLHYHNPVKSLEEIHSAYHDFGVRHFAIDDHAGLAKIATVVKQPGEVEISVRFKLPTSHAVHDFTTKFGADEKTAGTLLKAAAYGGFEPSMTFHPGSQCLDPRGFVEHIHAAAAIARESGIKLVRLNVGGGFPVQYPGIFVDGLNVFFDAIETAVGEAFGDNRPRLVAEPGRALCANAASVLVRVKHVRSDSSELFINDGVYGALMELTQYPVNLPARVIREGIEHNTANFRKFVVFGPTCDPIDKLPSPVSLPANIREGDWIEFGLVGAYGAATVTRFNGYGTRLTVAADYVISA